jgi:hypothetical protein
MLQKFPVVAGKIGITLEQIPVLDSVRTVSYVNTQKDDTKQKKERRGPCDPSARWGVMHSHRVKMPEGKTVEQIEYFYGYKANVIPNGETELITSVQVTGATGVMGLNCRGF